MKTYTFLFIAVAGLCLCSCSTSKTYVTWIDTYKKLPVSKGDLTEIYDSSLVILKKGVYQNISVDNIEKIRIRRRDRIGNGAILGALAGVAIGAIIGYAAGDDSRSCGSWACLNFTLSAKEKAGIGGVGGALGGAIAGSIIGLLKIKYPIGGDYQKYNRQKEKLEKYLHKDQL